uniref:Uncharacterized protein n=1 Tax=Anopheles epiroticus TaxID=199890 RepID=A0A182PS75_9DIPT
MRTCRACLQKEADEYYSIFKRVNQTTLDDMFQLLTGLAVVRGDGLPDCVCQECSDFIVMCNNFRKKCLKSDTQLRALLPTDKNANGQTQGELDEENSWTDETEIFLEEPVMDNGTSMTESTTNHEFDFEMYEVVEVVEPGEIEALDDYEIIQQDAKDAQQDGKEFTTPQQPVNEMKETTRPFVECCSCTGLQFASSAELKQHSANVHEKERIFNNLRPYECNVCYKRFISHATLVKHQAAPDRRVHELRHENIHPFKCPHCDKTYGRNYKLQVHIRRVHTKERPFECAICSECFYQHWEMLAHRRVEHGIIEIGSEG